MKKNVLSLLVLMIFGFVGNLYSQIEDPASWEAKVKKVSEEGVYEVHIEAYVEYPWYIYSMKEIDKGPTPTTFSYEENSGIEIIKTEEVTKSKKKFDEGFSLDVEVFYDKAKFKQTIKSAKGGNHTLIIEYQACNGQSCLALDKEIIINLGKEKKTEVSKINKESKKESDNNDSSLWGIFFIAFAGGLLALLTPCVFPMIPMTVSFFMQQKKRGKFKAIIFGLSIVFLYTLVGFLVSLTGSGDAVGDITSSWWLNSIFFILFMVFAASFFGMFEIVLPSSITNKADSQVDKGGIMASFFMALVTVLVSFSCTGPIVGTLLIQAVGGDMLAPTIGLFGFGLAFALPFTIFALSPGLMKNLPQSGGWMNTVKIILGFVILAFSFKFLVTIDQGYHLGILTRDVVAGILAVISFFLGLYIIGKIKFSHDSDMPYITFPKLVMAIGVFTFSLYSFTGMFGADLKEISFMMPPKKAQQFDLTKGGGVSIKNVNEGKKYSDLFEAPYGLEAFFDYEEGLAYAKKTGKPIFLDFKGHQCGNCKKMVSDVWSDSRVQGVLNQFVLIILYTDDKTKLPENEWVKGSDRKMKKTIGKKNLNLEISRFGNNSQPYYVMLNSEGEEVEGVKAKGSDFNVESYLSWLQKGISLVK